MAWTVTAEPLNQDSGTTLFLLDWLVTVTLVDDRTRPTSLRVHVRDQLAAFNPTFISFRDRGVKGAFG
jgi:hypothetical protein